MIMGDFHFLLTQRKLTMLSDIEKYKFTSFVSSFLISRKQNRWECSDQLLLQGAHTGTC